VAIASLPTWQEAREPVVISAADQALRKGSHFRDRTTVRDLWRAVGYFEQAIAAQPDHFDAYAGLADAYMLLGDDVLGALPAQFALTRAGDLARTAIGIEPLCGSAHATLAMVAWRLDWNWAGAEELFGRALALDPANATTFQYYSWLLQAAGRASEAREAMLHALALAPTSSFVSANVGWMLYLDRRYAEALGQLRETLELDENYALAYLPLGYALQQTGRLSEAIDHFRFGSIRAGDSFYRAALGQALAQAGFHGQATAILAECDSDHVSSYNRAMIHAALGNEEEALRLLESAAAEHSTAVPYLEVDPLFDRFRQSGRYNGIAQRVGFPRARG
jgi:tetratricopeptide (TPR) repeat protein